MRIHFIAIGGSAMHNLAIALHKKGYEITGSDDIIHEPSSSRLKTFGLLPKKFGWFEGNVTTDLDIVILGMHAKSDNPELLRAKDLGLKIYSYPEFLYEHSRMKTRVVIGGSHGKTTITSMILHVLKYHEVDTDYMVGAQIEGFENMVHLTDSNDFIVLEGDEYLSSPIDMRPKFHLYKPNIALLSGIAWDHINVFPTFENYREQFAIFTESLTNGGIMVYNEEDDNVVKVVETSQNSIKRYPYSTPDYSIVDGVTYIDTSDGPMPLQVFGEHNLQNLAGAKWICQHMGIDEDDFYEAIESFKGANKRLEKLAESRKTLIFKDFAHSPSKVKATTLAVKNQYKSKSILACLELHTYSSLNKEFLKEYQGALDEVDEAVVFYSPEAVKIKRLEEVSVEQIKKSFNIKNLRVFTNPKEFKSFLFSTSLEDRVLLLMSSGNYGGLNLEELKVLV
ncbi:UDP-N-acetylmuramate--L-alanine ligase [Tenacibaculum sp. C7A-26P2]|uniref:UDP-N-acetylmuramate--L-alanine ligase n=1 Tax=Tenacibaculum sp. C7A-26P2 TaxID=3447504 RepID=UPI003F8462BF